MRFWELSSINWKKDIDKEIAKGVEMMRESIHNEMRKSTHGEDNK